MSVTIYYHADCLDGFGAAYAAWRKFGSTARYLPMHHGEFWEKEDVSARHVFILDFSFRPEVLERMASLAASVTQIDHHASALKDWGARPVKQEDGAHLFQHPTLPLSVFFNLQKSGARLAWEYFQPASDMPRALRHIEDQDLWRFALPDTRAFCRTLRLQAFDFANWDELVRETSDENTARYRAMLEQGGAIERFLESEISRLAEGRLPMPAQLRGEPVDALQARRHGLPTINEGELSWLAIKGHAINASAVFTSELGHHLVEQHGSFVLVWQLAADGEVKASLRSTGDFDVAEIASRYGGGGHRNAAGFRLPALRFMNEVLGLT
jgi:uncharacterized protein